MKSMKSFLLVGLLTACTQVARPNKGADMVEWGGITLRYRADVSESSEPPRFAVVGTQQTGTYPPIQVINHLARDGEWISRSLIPDLPADEETSTNLFVHLPCESYDEVAFRQAAGYMQDPQDRTILKAQHRFNMRPGKFFMEIKASSGECRLAVYKVRDYRDRSTWQILRALPADVDKYFICEVSGPGC